MLSKHSLRAESYGRSTSREGDRAVFTVDDAEAINNYLASGAPNSFYGRHAFLKEYEEELASFFGRKHALLVNSGTSALYSAFFALGIGRGDEVLVPAYTFHASVTPLFQLGAVPVLVDVDPVTGNLDLAKARSCVTSSTRAVVVTHQAGDALDCSEFIQFLRTRNIALIEDVSLAVGASKNDYTTGSFGTVVCASLGSTKMLSGGQGGVALTDSDELYERMNLLGHFMTRSFEEVQDPFRREFSGTGFGMNFRMHALAVAISRARFHRLNELIAMRRARYIRLGDMLRECKFISAPQFYSTANRGSWHGFLASFDSRGTSKPLGEVVEMLRDKNIYISDGPYSPPLYRQALFRRDISFLPAYRDATPRLAVNSSMFPRTEDFVSSTIGFPLFLDEDMSIIERYGRACQEVDYALRAFS